MFAAAEYALNAMRGRGVSVLVRAAGLYGKHQAPRHISSTPALCVLVKSVSTPVRSLHYVAGTGDGSRAWSPCRVHHMSTAAPQAAEAEEAPEKQKPASEASDHGNEKPAMTKSEYWGLVPKQLTRQDGTPWRWTCFSVSSSCPNWLMLIPKEGATEYHAGIMEV